MSKLGATLMGALLVAAPALTGCGEEQDVGRAAAPDVIATATTAAAAVPEDLAGTWTVTLRRSELADPPDDLRASSSDWKLEFHATGGDDDGPSMTLENDELGTVVNPITLSGGEITMDVPIDCWIYSYAVEEERLAPRPSESGCPSTGLSSVLAARPWQRTQ